MSWHRLTGLSSGRQTKYLALVLWLVLASVVAPLAAKLTKVQNNDALMALPKNAEASTALGRGRPAASSNPKDLR
jgi:putative drug exporter of the RND superfamily